MVRGATNNFLDDIERSIDDGVNNFKVLARDGRYVAGAGAMEIELAAQISAFADTLPGLDQYAVRRFSEALEVLPKALAENSGLNGTEMINKLYLAHKESGGKNMGINIEADKPEVIDVTGKKLYDLYLLKHWGLKYAVSAACTVLKVDQIIMAKKAGGPKPPAAPGGAGSDEE